MGDRRRTFPFPRPVERVTALLFLILAVEGTVIAAEGETPEVRAAAHLEAGNARLDQGDFGGAAVEYRAGYALFPRASLLFNIGVAELRQEHLLDAATAFEGVLARPDASPEVVEQARAQLDRIHQRLARLRVKLAPTSGGQGAALSIDGKPQGTLPHDGPIRLLPGPHTVRASKPGFQPFERQVSGRPGSEVDLSIVALEPLRAPPPPTRRYWLWGTIGAAVAAAAVIGFIAVQRREAGFAPCPPGPPCSDIMW
jgi:hypothetical protein